MLPNENSERPDAIILFNDVVYVLEFKTIGNRVKHEYATQFIDYRTILNEYHQATVQERLCVRSYLVMCSCTTESIQWVPGVQDELSPEDIAAVVGYDRFRYIVEDMIRREPKSYENTLAWVESRRSRSLKIWEQGKQIKNILTATGTGGLYSKVKSIPFSDLQPTQSKINELIKKDERKVIFVSGVPGAGKTLIGMITLFGCLGDHKHARYYTGNGALQNVLSHLMDTRDISMFTGFREYYFPDCRGNVCNEEVLIF